MAPKSEHVGEASNIASPPSQGEILAVIADVTRVQQSVQEAHRNMKIHVGGKRFFVHLGALDNRFSRCFNGPHFASASHAFGSAVKSRGKFKQKMCPLVTAYVICRIENIRYILIPGLYLYI